MLKDKLITGARNIYISLNLFFVFLQHHLTEKSFRLLAKV